MENENKKRGVTILQIRWRLGLSQDTLAKLSRVSRQAICRWEAGEKAEAIKLMPYMQKLNELAEHYKVLADDEVIVSPSIRTHGKGTREHR